MLEGEKKDKRQRLFRVEAIVLRHSDLGEADRLLWLFTLEMGKIRAIAKGVRRIRSRKAGHLEPFTRVNVLLAKGRDLPIITQADTIDAYLPLRADLAGMTYTSYVVELIDRFTYEEGEARGLFKLLVETLERLSKETDKDLVIRFFELHMLEYAGFKPQLFRCLACNEEILPRDQYFSAREGGALCPKCGSRSEGARPISMRALKAMRHFQRSSYIEAKRLRLSAEVNREVEMLMQHYLTYLLERSLNTPPFLRRLRRSSHEPQV